jgi:hypothetical protein
LPNGTMASEDEKENRRAEEEQGQPPQGQGQEHALFCSVEGCRCACRVSYQVKRCSTIEEVSEPTNTITTTQGFFQFSSQPTPSNRQRDSPSPLWRSQNCGGLWDCIANHTRSREQLPPDPPH